MFTIHLRNVISWRRIKRGLLHHFHKPRLDLLVWVLVVKLTPTYYRKLDQMMVDNGQYRELPSWRKAFKREWKKAAKTPIVMPLNDKYRPHSRKWVCTCPHFITSHFLLCKHLVQSVLAVPPVFFLEVKRNRTTPFWKHKLLVPLDASETDSDAHTLSSPTLQVEAEKLRLDSGSDEEQSEGEESDNDVVDTENGVMGGSTFSERMMDHIGLLQTFVDGLEYQIQFHDQRMLDRLEREGASFLRFAQSCISRERRMNSTRGVSPTTWETATASAMYYRTRPPVVDKDT
jgi:hypothetical protein